MKHPFSHLTFLYSFISTNGLSSHTWRIPAFPATAAFLVALVGGPGPGGGEWVRWSKGKGEACSVFYPDRSLLHEMITCKYSFCLTTQRLNV
jgi:hypothetical protein